MLDTASDPEEELGAQDENEGSDENMLNLTKCVTDS